MVYFVLTIVICLNIGFWCESFMWTWCIFNLTTLNWKSTTPVFSKRFSFSKKFISKLKYWNVQNFQWQSHENMPVSRTEGYYENPLHYFLEGPMIIELALKWNLQEKAFSSVKTKSNAYFSVKFGAKRSNHSFLLSTWRITFFLHLFSLIRESGMCRT